MSNKILVATAAAVLLASNGWASARTKTNSQALYSDSYYTQALHSESYDNKTYWDAVAPQGRIHEGDPYAGTIWEGVVPYVVPY